MSRYRIPQRGDVYWIDPNPIAGREMKDLHRFVVITPKAVNALGVAMTVPVTSGGDFARKMEIAVPVMGHDTTGVAVCNQVRSFDIHARIRSGNAKYIETLSKEQGDDIADHVLSLIEPA